MQNIVIKKATKEQSKLRLALFGVSGSGKTKSALRIAKGLSGNILVIDSERGSAAKYADENYEFHIIELEAKNIDTYVAAINAAKEFDVLIIDSLTHAWQELLTEVEKIAQAKYHGNTWSAWSQGTPKQRSLIDALLSFPGHVIATMRCKTEWAVDSNEKGKIKPQRVGLSPEQGKGIEYEFDLLMELSPEHVANVIKDRTGKFQDEFITCPDEAFGKRLGDWLKDGASIDDIMNDYLGKIKKTTSLDDLKSIYMEAYKKTANNEQWKTKLEKAKDTKKALLIGKNNTINTDTPTSNTNIPDAVLSGYLDKLMAADGLELLTELYDEFLTQAKKLKDTKAMGKLKTAYETRKKEIEELYKNVDF